MGYSKNGSSAMGVVDIYGADLVPTKNDMACVFIFSLHLCLENSNGKLLKFGIMLSNGKLVWR